MSTVGHLNGEVGESCDVCSRKVNSGRASCTGIHGLAGYGARDWETIAPGSRSRDFDAINRAGDGYRRPVDHAGVGGAN